MKDILFYWRLRQFLKNTVLMAAFTSAFFCCNALGIEYPKALDPLNPTSFTHRITGSQSSILYFFKCYNNSYYIERVLPCFLMHIDDLLAQTSRHTDGHEYITSVFSLFHERLSACSWVQPLAYASFLDKLTSRIGNYFNGSVCSLKEQIFNTCKNNFHTWKVSSQSSTVYTDDQKTDALTKDLLKTIKTHDKIKQNQALIVRFLENGLSKLLWDSRDALHAWKSFKLLGMQLEHLHKSCIVPDQATLNHLLWWLINRFIYWLELEGSSIPLTDYEKIKKEVAENKILFLLHKEQKSVITPKAERLYKALETGYTKAYFYHKKGIITDPLPKSFKLAKMA